ncbi:unnamed protein product [Fraxinus pennsylvanica]|uniref:Uncharacterized protein n=1 Tax=Fraxinus pennsylvanica TaxID=56036 RepID=A0AAD2AIE8_9LAMI|nr:unnamed protein product [Fraxinus pennsylvanica]
MSDHIGLGTSGRPLSKFYSSLSISGLAFVPETYFPYLIWKHIFYKNATNVCRGSNCGIQFHQINEAYDRVMSNLREESSRSEMMTMYEEYDTGTDESMRGINEQDLDLWEEWMGWEGAGIRDYSSHINPYI